MNPIIREIIPATGAAMLSFLTSLYLYGEFHLKTLVLLMMFYLLLRIVLAMIAAWNRSVSE